MYRGEILLFIYIKYDFDLSLQNFLLMYLFYFNEINKVMHSELFEIVIFCFWYFCCDAESHLLFFCFFFLGLAAFWKHKHTNEGVGCRDGGASGSAAATVTLTSRSNKQQLKKTSQSVWQWSAEQSLLGNVSAATQYFMEMRTSVLDGCSVSCCESAFVRQLDFLIDVSVAKFVEKKDERHRRGLI